MILDHQGRLGVFAEEVDWIARKIAVEADGSTPD